jgi:alpha-ribazole phosphatase
MFRLLLIRHGETAWNQAGRYVGRTDLPLNDLGRRQAEALARRLADETIDAVYTSDYRRAAETAEEIARPHNLPVQQEPRLREIDFGLWEGLTMAEIRDRFPAELSAWRESPRVAPPEGESIIHLVGRVSPWLEEVMGDHEGQTLAVCAHGGTFQMMLYTLLEIPLRSGWTFYLYNGSISEVHVRVDGAALVRLNDTNHLDRQA